MADSEQLDPTGGNLASRLFRLLDTRAFDRIIRATESILGLPGSLSFHDREGAVYFRQFEPGLAYGVHQVGASSGTLRMLALMTALLGDESSRLIGIEEPENHVHPTALQAFVDHLKAAPDDVQVLITTHSPLVLDCLDDPSAVRVVSRTADLGTRVQVETHADAVRQALAASGLGLGELYETRGFGA